MCKRTWFLRCQVAFHFHNTLVVIDVVIVVVVIVVDQDDIDGTSASGFRKR
jgi:hypothetical protein